MANTSCLLNSFLRELADGCTDTHFALTVLTDLMAQAATQNRDAVIENHGIIALGTRRSGDCSAAPMPLAMSSEIADTASLVVSEIRAPAPRAVYEGPITINDLGMAIQDVGNGVGIIHITDLLGDVQLGEVMRIVYPSAKATPNVERISRPAESPAPRPLSDQLGASLDAMHEKLHGQEQRTTPAPQGELRL